MTMCRQRFAARLMQKFERSPKPHIRRQKLPVSDAYRWVCDQSRGKGYSGGDSPIQAYESWRKDFERRCYAMTEVPLRPEEVI